MFRKHGMGSFRDLLIEISKDPAMIFFLDNCLSHKESINENYGRELLELFSLGVGKDGEYNYTEDDVKECARAFTGWTISNPVPGQPYGRYSAKFVYVPEDHDDVEKDLPRRDAGASTARDTCLIHLQAARRRALHTRHLYSTSWPDEPGVPIWMETPPPREIGDHPDAGGRSNCSGLQHQVHARVLPTSDAFKNAPRFPPDQEVQGDGDHRHLADW